MESLLSSDNIDDRLIIAYLEEEFNNVWHGSWEEMIAYYHSIKDGKGFRKIIFDDFKDWYNTFSRTARFRELLANESVRAAIIDMADYEDSRKAAYNAVYYPRIAYNNVTAFERLITSLYNDQKSDK
jgi:hypothetical protein